MPFGSKPECVSCQATDANIWRKNENDEIICNDCHLGIKRDDNGKADDNRSENGSSHKRGNSHQSGPLRKSARLKPSKYRYQGSYSHKPLATKGKSRRVIFKKNPIRAPAPVSTPMTTDSLFFKGLYFQVGDVVSVMDEEGDIYYAQLRGFLQDQYMNKSAVITWLLPTTDSPPEGFDPSTFILGPEEDLPRKMEVFEFVCNAPSDYFKDKLAPYPTLPTKPEIGYVWTSMRAEIIPIPSNDEMYGLKPLQPEEKKMRTKREKGEGKGDKVKGEGRGRGAGRPPKVKDEPKEIIRDKDKRTIIRKEKMSL